AGLGTAGAIVAACCLGVAGVAWARRRRLARTEPWVTSSRRARATQLVRLGSKVGTVQVSARAQRVFASAARREELDRSMEMRTAAQVVETLGSMKGVMMKLGQMASYLDEGLPEAYRSALGQLQSDAPPMAPELSEAVVREELGASPGDVFAAWDPLPMAAASIGQVHRAITADGQAVAVKVQYPGAAEAMAADLQNTDMLARALTLLFPSLDPSMLVSELRARLSEELDYRVEASNQRSFASYYAGHPFISVPAVRDDLSSARVLTMELAEGARLEEVEGWSKRERDLAGEAIFRFVFRSLYRMSAFNGDPHPGNYLFAPGGRVTFLDYGLVKRFEPSELAVFEEMIRTLVLRPDAEAFRSLMEAVGLLARSAPVPTGEVLRFFGDFYALVRERGRMPVTAGFASQMVRHVFDAGDPVTRYTNVPPMFVVVQRINLGLYGVLARLGAEADWRSVAEELWPMVDAAPSTPLGEAEAAWLGAGGGKAA
ncbi:MAG: ABC1 kinase family protein, partial [Acidimicrobiales bacterium]